MKKEVIDAANSGSVAKLFHTLWHLALQWPTEDQNLAEQDECRERLFSKILERSEESDICHALANYTLKHMDNAPTDAARGVVLDMMAAIDGAFSQIHPRKQAAAGIVWPKPIPQWLKDYRIKRRNEGSYFANDRDRLITRGPLAKTARTKDAANAANIEDCFVSLSVVPIFYESRGRQIRTDVKVFSKSAVSGFSTEASKPPDISLMPIAENAADISITCTPRNRRLFAKYESSDAVAVADLLIKILATETEQGPTIAVAPELLVDTRSADRIEERYGDVEFPPQILVCGSGHSAEMKGSQAWNESRVINLAGIELWRQRKIWPASIDATWAKNYGLSDPAPHHLHEDNCAGDTLIVADLDDMGRCLIMICQDFEANSLADVVIRCYQPDWVFVPILDRSVDVGRWGHSRAFGLSGLSQARFVVVSSTALNEIYKAHSKSAPKTSRAKPFALLVSPKISEGGDSRVYKSLTLKKSDPRRAVKVPWRPQDDGWKKTTLS